MEIQFIGPLGKVTGSCTWMRDSARGWNFLVDCGMQQGERTATQWNSGDWPFNPKDLKFVILTHAHIDHCGLIPMLYRRGFNGPVYCASETAAIAAILLRDAATVSDLGFTAGDVDAVQWREPARGPFFGKHHPLDQDLFAMFYRSGHVVGAVTVTVSWGARGLSQRSIAFSGDLGPNREDLESLPFMRHRMNIRESDFAVVESTYGGTIRTAEQADPATRREQLRQLLDRTIERGGVLAIPAFALGRIQDVLFDLHWIVAEHPARYEGVAFRLDAPSALKMNAVVCDAMQRTENNGKNGKVRPLWLGKQMFRWFGLDDTKPAHERAVLDICRMTLLGKQATAPFIHGCGNAIARAWRPLFDGASVRHPLPGKHRAAVLLLTSGSCDGGPARHWLPELLTSSANTVAVAGYCSPATVGGQLLSMAQAPLEERHRLSGDIIWPATPALSMPMAKVKAEVVALAGYSAHADQAGLLEWIFAVRPDQNRTIGSRLVFIQHGADPQRTALAEAIILRARAQSHSVASFMPRTPAQWFDLERGGAAIMEEARTARIKGEIARLEAELGAF